MNGDWARPGIALLIAVIGFGVPAATAPAADDTGGEAEAGLPIPIAIAAPLVVPPGNSVFIDAEALEDYTSEGGILDQQLVEMVETDVAIGIDPRLLASIRILGNEAPASAVDWLDRLESAPNETFPLRWADADMVTPLRAGATDILEPKSLEFAIVPNRFDEVQSTEANTSPPTPAPTDEPTPLPEAADLTAWDYTWPQLAWPTAGTLGTGDLVLLSEAGFSHAIVSGDEIRRAQTDRRPAVMVDGVTVAAADSILSELLSKAVTAPTTADWSAATAALSAALAALSEASPDQAPPMLLTLERSWPSTNYRLAETVSSIAGQPWVATAGLSQVFGENAGKGELVGNPVDEARVERVGQLLSAEESEVRFLGIVQDPLAATSPRRAQLLSLLSNAWRATPEAWVAATDEFLLESEAIRASVQIVDSSTINLYSDRGALPVTVSNSLDQAVTVYIEVRPQSAILAVENPRVELVIEPGLSRRGSIPVTSLSNGQVDVTVRLYDGAGNRIGDTTEVAMNVNAGWETAGTLIFAGLVVVVFAIGLVRNIRKRRRATNV